jgi:hypothetical protein
MRKVITIVILFVFFLGISSSAQVNTHEKKELTGIIINYDNIPIKGVRIFVDSMKTNIKTDKKGFYKILLSDQIKIITAYSPSYGKMDVDYKGQDTINFVFPKDNQVFDKKEFKSLGYGVSNYGDDYSQYRDIFQIFRAKFQNVEVIGEDVKINGAGLSLTSQNGFIKPIYIVNGYEVSSISNIAPADIKSISVERSNSIYGSRGAGGVIKIKLK